MRIAGILLMFSGWLIAISALAVLHAASVRTAFLCAGIVVEGVGLALLQHVYAADVRWESQR